MSQNTLCSEILERYNYHRSELIKLCGTVGSVLEESQKLQGREAAYETPVEALRKDSYTLVLIGAFQSGKSTLFNYLCDGRELSPIGPGGGGVRTSGCMVTAHAVKSGAKEHARVIWRKPGQLLAALGTPLLKYFENPTSTESITDHDIDLANPADREKLAGFAIEELQSGNTRDIELLRFTLVVCRFFDRFDSRCEANSSESSPDEAMKLTSYPQDWLPRWEQIEKSGDWELHSFSAEEVNFAFCGGVELYLDSPNLRSMGCSVIDCPGLFISKWDSEIATECIRKTNAILYMFSGRQAMTPEDEKALESCVQLGGRHKVIFGANLHVGRAQWDRILTNSVLPILRKHGFENPVVHNFHSAMALRAREQWLNDMGRLSCASRSAIEISKVADEYTDSTDEYLNHLLNMYICNLTGFRQNLGNYLQNYGGIEALSGVPGFVQAAHAHVVGTRVSSTLIHEGVHKLVDALKLAAAELEQKRNLLNMGVDKALEECGKWKKNLKDFRESRQVHEETITSALDRAMRAIHELYRYKLEQLFKNREQEMIEVTAEHIPGIVDMIFKDKHQLILSYTSKLGEVLASILKQVSDDILENFKSLPPVTFLKQVFESNRKELMKKLAVFNGIGSISDMQVYFPDDFADSVKGMILPTAGNIFIKHVGRQNNVWAWIWAILTCGITRLFVDKKAEAKYILDKHRNELIQVTHDMLMECLNQQAPDGPVMYLKNTVLHFGDCFQQAEDQITASIETAEAILTERRNDASIIDGINNQIAQISRVQEACATMKQSIQADFPERDR